MNNTIWTAISSIFTGKGGTVRLAIFGSLLVAGAYELFDNKYQLNVRHKDGSVSISPAQSANVETAEPQPAPPEEQKTEQCA